MVFFGGQLSRNTTVATIPPYRNFGSATPFRIHRATSIIERPSNSLRPFRSGELDELNGFSNSDKIVGAIGT